MMTLAERCKLATDCIPQAEYRTRLEALHAELLASAAQQVAAERERIRGLVEAVRAANGLAEDGNTFRLLKPGQERAWLALLGGLGDCMDRRRVDANTPKEYGCHCDLELGLPKREHPTCTLTPAELNHLRRLLGWVRCEVGQPPDEMVAMVQNIVGQLGEPNTEGKARLVEAHAEAGNVPQYVRAAIKALAKTLAANPELPEAEDVGVPVLPAPNADVTGKPHGAA